MTSSPNHCPIATKLRKHVKSEKHVKSKRKTILLECIFSLLFFFTVDNLVNNIRLTHPSFAPVWGGGGLHFCKKKKKNKIKINLSPNRVARYPHQRCL